MIKYILLAVVFIAVTYKFENTGNLKYIWEMIASFLTFTVLYFVDLVKEMI